VFEEKSHKEIASMLGISEHTSSSQFYRAKTLLMKKINEYRKSI
ncbi:MAG: RNA polymerase sigma factor, partial [Phocaeicola sp.]